MIIDTTDWRWPQYTMVILTLINIVLTVRDNGKPRKPENINVTLVGAMITYFILISGGFFK